MSEFEQLIDSLGLEPHPEGGYFTEVYRSAEEIPSKALPDRYEGARAYCSSIYYLLPKGEVSKFHRLKSDEIWHVYQGGGLRMLLIDDEGELSEVLLGAEQGVFQAVVPKGVWMAAEPIADFALLGCTVSPAFTFEDFEFAPVELLKGREELKKFF